MPNNWFQFKKFLVRQENSSMKVGTDGVLLGAWTKVPEPGGKALDVGTGTGLIALMIAQRTENVRVDAVEIDQSACKQAMENFSVSAWKGRLNIFNLSFQQFIQDGKDQYNLITCNPPFFSNSLKARDKGRNIARHDDRLNSGDLFKYSSIGLKKEGILTIIIPFSRLEEMTEIAAQYSLYCNRLAKVKPVPGRLPKRAIMEFSKLRQKFEEEEFVLEEEGRHSYSSRYRELTREFYL